MRSFGRTLTYLINRNSGGGDSVPGRTSRVVRIGSAEWWANYYRIGDSRKRRAGGLTLDRILSAALELADERGLDCLTMRELAAKLGTAHTSLYRHVANREELLVRLVDFVLSEIEHPKPGLPVRQRAEYQAREMRRVLLLHRSVVPLLVSGQLLGPNALRAREVALAASSDEGISPEFAAKAYLSIAHFVIGSVLLDSGGSSRTVGERRSMEKLFASLPEEEYPTVRAMSAALNEPDPESEFEFGLKNLLDGIQANSQGG